MEVSTPEAALVHDARAQGHRQYIATLGTLDEDRTGQWMDEIEIGRRHILGLGAEVEVGDCS
jgi:hypothetical protein